MQPTLYEDFTPSTTKCALCSQALVKQHLHVETKLPLSFSEREDLHRALRAKRHALECRDCGGRCWVPLDRTPPLTGLCRGCGGQHSRMRPQGLLDYAEANKIYKRFALVAWSCPEHGFL